MFDLQDFVHQCREALAEPQPARVIESLVQSALSNPDEVRAAFAEVASGQPPGLITFAALDATLTVADITTPPGLRSPAHDHQMWAVIGVYEGQELNEFYRYEGSEFTKRGARLLKEGDVAILGANAIHAIANPLPTQSSAIHVYGGHLGERESRSIWNPHSNEREPYEMDRLLSYVKELSEPAP